MSPNSEPSFSADIAIAPGETLRDTLTAIGMTQKDLARRMGVTPKLVNEIFMGKAPITYETAIKLEKVIGVSAQFWSNLEANYRTTLEKIRIEKNLREQEILAKGFPYGEIAKLGWIKNPHNPNEKILELQRFFGVADLNILKNELNKLVDLEATYRRCQKRTPSREALLAWLRQGEIIARKVETKPFNIDLFRQSLSEIKDQVLHARDFDHKIQNICAKSGVAVVYVPHLKRTYVNGAARWLSPDKGLIQLSIRHKYTDIFWFSLFHEAAHILCHRKKEKFIDIEGDSETKTDEEIEADKFAADFLIPNELYSNFINRNDFSINAVKNFATSIRVPLGIVIGRLQHDQFIGYNYLNAYRQKLEWASN